MNEQNENLLKKISRAKAAIQFLTQAGCIVDSVDIGNRNTLIKLQEKPNGGFITGAFKKRDFINGAQVFTMVATVRQCQVEWDEVILSTPERAHG